MKKIISYFVLILVLFTIYGCDTNSSIVQNILEKDKITVFQSPKENGDLIIFSSYYDLEKNVEYSIDNGATWLNVFTLEYEYIIDFDSIEIWMRKKEIITPYKTFLKSPNIVFNHIVKEINTDIPNDFDEFIVADPIDRISQVSEDVLNGQTFLVASEHDCGFSLSAHIKENNIVTILTNNMEFALVEENEKQSNIYDYYFNWVNFPEFSELQYDLNKTYFLLWRYKDNSNYIESITNELEINPQTIFE